MFTTVNYYRVLPNRRPVHGGKRLRGAGKMSAKIEYNTVLMLSRSQENLLFLPAEGDFLAKSAKNCVFYLNLSKVKVQVRTRAGPGMAQGSGVQVY